MFERVTFLIAIASFLMSAISWGRELWFRRNRVDLSVIDYCSYSRTCVQFYLRFHNRSTLPASVSCVTVRIGDTELVCELDQKHIRSTPAGHMLESPAFPLSLPPVAFSAHYLEFLTDQDIPLTAGTQVVFVIHTSRGEIVQETELPSEAHYLHKKCQR